MNIIELGVLVKDNASQLEGMLTHACVSPDMSVEYIFQPRGINPETGHPVSRLLVGASRFDNPPMIDAPIPVEVMNTIVTDSASGLTGKATRLIYHLNGCIHVDIQPAGVVEKTKNPIASIEMDIRRLSGPAIKVMTKEERQADMAERPSPMDSMRREV